MPLHEDKAIFPHAIPQTVPSVSFDENGHKELVKYVQDINRTVSEISRQLYDKYNKHLKNGFAHYQSHKFFRSQRPRLKYSESTLIVIEASPDYPIYFVFGEARRPEENEQFRIMEVTSNITIDVDDSGPGGIDTGSKANNTLYYVYGVYNNGQASAVYSASNPTVGPTGYNFGQWTYLGAFLTDSSGNVRKFAHESNRMILIEPLAIASAFTNTTFSSSNIKMPVGSRNAMIGVEMFMGTSAGEDREIQVSYDGSNVTRRHQFTNSKVAGLTSQVEFDFPMVHSSKTIWYKISSALPGTWAANLHLFGWEEDVTVYA